MFETAVRRIRLAKEQNDPHLNLSQLELDDVPREIGELTHLESVDLSHNKLHELPDEVRQLTKVSRFDMSANNFAVFPEVLLQLWQLKELSISFNLLDELPDGFDVYQALEFLDSSNNEFETIPGVITRLTALKTLQSFKCDATRIPDNIGDLQQLHTLNLIRNQLSSLPESLGELKNLKHLYMADNLLAGIPAPVFRITGLENLSLGSNSIKEIPPEIGSLANLKELSLNYNEVKFFPPEMRALTQLEMLQVGKNQLEEIPEYLYSFTRLRDLRLRRNHISSLSDKIGNLRDLETLHLEFNEITEIPESMQLLTKLKNVNLSNNKITYFPKELCFLPEINSLSIRDNPIENLSERLTKSHFNDLQAHFATIALIEENLKQKAPSLTFSEELYLKYLPDEIGTLTHLESLTLNPCRLYGLPENFTNLKNLKELHILKNNFHMRQFPEELFQLPNLRKITLEETLIEEIPPELLKLDKLEEVNLDKRTVKNIPPEIIDRGWEAIKPFLIGISGGAFAEMHEAKIIVVGSGGVGKTTLTRKLIDPNFDLTETDEPSTEGIDIRFWPLLLDDERELMCNFWDFGGQEIYHSTHQFFLTKRTLYIFVTEARKEDNYLDFDYWLNIIQALSDGSPVLIVLNKSDERVKEVDETGLRRKFPNIKGFHRVSCLSGKGIDELKESIRGELRQMEHITSEIPMPWKAVRNRLGKLSQEKDFISLDAYMEICKEANLPESDMPVLSDYLHDMGILLHFREDMALNHTVILRSEWGTHAVYNVLDTPHIIENLGSFTNSDLQSIWQAPEYPSDRHPALLALMKKFGLCFQLEPSTYIAPQLLPINPPVYTWDDTDNFRVEYWYSQFMPPGIFTRFLVELKGSIYQDLCWKHGMVIEWEGGLALIEENLLERKISAKVRGDQPSILMGVIRHEFSNIHRFFPGLEYKEMLPCICSECSSNPDPYFFDVARLRKFRSKGKEVITCDQSVEDVAILDLFHAYEGMRHDTANQDIGMKKIVILFLAANPLDTTRLRIGKEVRQIEEGLRGAKYRDRFELRQKWAVTADTLRTALLDTEPAILHFSGHGVSSRDSEVNGAGSRGLQQKSGRAGTHLVFEDEQGNAHEISGEALSSLFELFAGKLNCVVLNACYSEGQATVILQHVPYVIGMNAAIPDEAAIAFSEGFYDALGAGRNIEEAYKFGKNAIELHGISGRNIPVLRKRGDLP